MCQVSSDSVNRTFTALIICEKGNEEGKDDDNAALPHLYNTSLFIPEGSVTGRAQTQPQNTSADFDDTIRINFPVFLLMFVRLLQPHGAEVEASGRLGYHSENPESDTRKDH